MFLTRKSFRKILTMAICYASLGSTCIIASLLLNTGGISDKFLFILGLISYLLCVLFAFWGRYAEGKGRLIALGNKLVRKELKPMEFINHYEMLKNSNDLVIKKPCIEVLQLVAVAYDSLDDRQNVMATVNEMIEVASEKKKAFANLLKSAFLFDYGNTEKAELLFNENKSRNKDMLSVGLADAILKCERAMAMGDYKTVEAYNLNLINRKFPKLDNLTKLAVNYRLGEVYKKLNENEKAVNYYRYCAEFGGETAIKKSAVLNLQNA